MRTRHSHAKHVPKKRLETKYVFRIQPVINLFRPIRIRMRRENLEFFLFSIKNSYFKNIPFWKLVTNEKLD